MRWWRVLSYLVYESADSAWSLIVVSVYFGAFVQYAMGEPETDFGWALTAGNVIVELLSPLLGASADVSGRRQPYLRVFVFAAAAFTAGIEFASSSAIAVLLFSAAYVCVNAAFTFYTALLPAVANERSLDGSRHRGGIELCRRSGDARHAAVVALAAYVLLGAAIVFTLPDVRPTSANLLVR
jgi:UMF1 family MFS transporter